MVSEVEWEWSGVGWRWSGVVVDGVEWVGDGGGGGGVVMVVEW